MKKKKVLVFFFSKVYKHQLINPMLNIETDKLASGAIMSLGIGSITVECFIVYGL